MSRVKNIYYGESFRKIASELEIEDVDESKIILIDAEKCISKAEIFHEFSSKLNLPEYLSTSWDSFDECVSDLPWFCRGNLIIGIYNFPDVSVANKEFSILLEILTDSVDEWAVDGSLRRMFVCAISENEEGGGSDLDIRYSKD